MLKLIADAVERRVKVKPWYALFCLCVNLIFSNMHDFWGYGFLCDFQQRH